MQLARAMTDILPSYRTWVMSKADACASKQVLAVAIGAHCVPLGKRRLSALVPEH